MDTTHVDNIARFLTGLPSRRDILRGLAGMGLGLGLARWQPTAEARKKRKHRKKGKKPKPNAFGCFGVGVACKSAAQCCSGICDGKKGKRTCRAHDTGTCNQRAPGVCKEANPLLALCNDSTECICFHTTAGSNVCAEGFGISACADCQKDADCLALGFPPGSACAPVAVGICTSACEGGMACLVPCGTELPER